MTEEKSLCAICKKDIKEIGCYPIYSKKHTDVICSNCCTLGALVSLEVIKEIELSQIPIRIKKEIINLYKK